MSQTTRTQLQIAIEPASIARLTKLPKEDLPKVTAALVAAVAEFITGRYGVAWWKAAELAFEIETVKWKTGARAAIPMTPVVAVSRVTSIHGKDINYQLPGLPRPVVKLVSGDEIDKIRVQALVGWVDHPARGLERAVAEICEAWIRNPSLAGKNEGPHRANVEQFLSILRPRQIQAGRGE